MDKVDKIDVAQSDKPILKRDIKGGYDLPDGYFADLKANVMAQVGQDQQKSWSATLKSLLGFVAGFAVMVLFAVGIVNLTPEQKLDKAENELAEVENFMIYSDLFEDDVVEMVYQQEMQTQSEVQSETQIVEDTPESIDNEQFNEAVDEYVNALGGLENE